MLTDHVDRYVALRQALGYGLRKPARHLHAFARFADAKGDTHIRTSTAVAWATDAPSPSARHIRLRDVVHLARFLHAEDAAHEVPPATLFPAPKMRPLPYIYPPGEVAQIVAAAGRLRRTYPLRREVHDTLRTDRRDGAAGLGSARPAVRRSAAQRRAADPADKVRQEPACPAASYGGGCARPLPRSAPQAGRDGRPCVPFGIGPADWRQHGELYISPRGAARGGRCRADQAMPDS